MSQLADIENREDINQLVKAFYDKVLLDPIIGFIFTDVAKIDLELHLPIIADFWDDVLFRGSQHQARKYRGNAMQVHLDLNNQLPLMAGHFTRWLFLFNQTVDDYFIGKNAEKAKKRAELVAKSIAAQISGHSKNSLKLTLS